MTKEKFLIAEETLHNIESCKQVISLLEDIMNQSSNYRKITSTKREAYLTGSLCIDLYSLVMKKKEAAEKRFEAL